MKALAQEFWQEEDGFQTVEMVLILIVMVALVVSFRNFALDWMTKITTTISDHISDINGNTGPLEP